MQFTKSFFFTKKGALPSKTYCPFGKIAYPKKKNNYRVEELRELGVCNIPYVSDLGGFGDLAQEENFQLFSF